MPKSGAPALKALREARGLTQVELADRAQLTRQSIGAIEAGRVTPSVDVALRIAQALETTVELLFAGEQAPEKVWAEVESASIGSRVLLAEVSGRLVGHVLGEERCTAVADGQVISRGKGRAEIELFAPLAETSGSLLLAGCATGLGLLAERLNRRSDGPRVAWLPCASTPALSMLAERRAHIAGVHLVDARTGSVNVPDVRRAAFPEPVVLVRFARWEAGLVARPSGSRRVQKLEDLTRRGVRWVRRESGAGAQRLLERELARHEIPSKVVAKATMEAKSHFALARLVASGAADIGVAPRDVAIAFGLSFSPLAEECFDLVFPTASLGDPRMVRIMDLLSSARFRRELGALGYDVNETGDRIAEVGVA